jgi:hypothetical protein
MRHFVDAYFEMWHPLYPFIHGKLLQELVSKVQEQSNQQSSTQAPQQSQSLDHAQLFLVIALGARILESRLSTNFASESYYATAMFHVSRTQLHDSIRGVQVLPLLVLGSFSFVNGPNTWFLTSTIIASFLGPGVAKEIS